MAEETYKQTMPGLDLTIERATERTPDTRNFHLFLNGELVESFKKLDAAQREFRRMRDESGWKPEPKPELSAAEKLARDRELTQRTAYMEYWSQSHKFRGGGRPKRK